MIRLFPGAIPDPVAGPIAGSAGHEQPMTSPGTATHEGSSGRLQLPDDTTAPRKARSHTRRVLGSWLLPGLLEPLLLVVSELVTNAVRHGKPPVELLLRRVGSGVRVDVHDESSAFGPPVRPRDWAGDEDAEGGRGLSLIAAVSVDHGVDQILHDGKRVWAVVEPPAEAPA